MVLNPWSKLQVWPLSRSLAATWEIDFSFSSSGYLDVSVPRVALRAHTLLCTLCSGIAPSGFPHSDICGSTDICSSPQLFAACHVLLRLPVPRHPPHALLCLAFKLAIDALPMDFRSPWQLSLPELARSTILALFLSKNFNCFNKSLLTRILLLIMASRLKS